MCVSCKIDRIPAVKSNCDPIVIKTLVSLGTGFDCASKGEIESVLRFGVPSDLIVYANPTKNISHIKYAAKINVRSMTVDSHQEIEKLSKHYPNAKYKINTFNRNMDEIFF